MIARAFSCFSTWAWFRYLLRSGTPMYFLLEEGARTMAEEEAIEESIAREVLDRRKETLKSKMEFWEIVHHARKSELVKDEFVDRLMREGLSAKSNEELVTKFLKEITVQSGWFDRFTSILGGISKYRHLAVQLNDGEFGRNIILSYTRLFMIATRSRRSIRILHVYQWSM